MTPLGILQSLFDYKLWANAEMLSAIESLDESAQGDVRERTIRTLNHTHVVDNIFSAHLRGIDHGYDATNTVQTPAIATLRREVALTDEWYRTYVRTIETEDLDHVIRFTFTDGDPGELSRHQILLHVINHGSYHRGAIGRVLQDAGCAPPRDTLTRYWRNSRWS